MDRLRWQIGCDTDIGGGRENQDDYFVWQRPSQGICVACVLDGHGREVGKVAATAAKRRLVALCEDTFSDLLADPCAWLVRAHEIAHQEIKSAFQAELESQGFLIRESPEGYLLKQRTGTHNWSCVHGGSSCSIVVLIGFKMFIANVGDSSATLATNYPVLNSSTLCHVVDSALSSTSSLRVTLGGHSLSTSQNSSESINTLMIIAEHSPESVYEFCRLREFRPREDDPAHPSLMVVYDSPSMEKARCNPVFEFNSSGHPVVTNRGRYYKNVRKEWASLVSTPLSAKFQDALAFTRSLGDLHLHTYGVSHLPEVQMVDLSAIFRDLETTAQRKMFGGGGDGGEMECVAPPNGTFTTNNNHTNGVTSSSCMQSDEVAAPSLSPGLTKEYASPFPVVCLVLATDGVWDNWTYEDVTKFVLDPSCLGAVAGNYDGAHRVALSFMQRNGVYAKRNFGTQADNATGIVMYISCSPMFPASPEFNFVS